MSSRGSKKLFSKKSCTDAPQNQKAFWRLKLRGFNYVEVVHAQIAFPLDGGMHKYQEDCKHLEHDGHIAAVLRFPEGQSLQITVVHHSLFCMALFMTHAFERSCSCMPTSLSKKKAPVQNAKSSTSVQGHVTT
jgi:hypothetical protein